MMMPCFKNNLNGHETRQGKEDTTYYFVKEQSACWMNSECSPSLNNRTSAMSDEHQRIMTATGYLLTLK